MTPTLKKISIYFFGKSIVFPEALQERKPIKPPWLHSDVPFYTRFMGSIGKLLECMSVIALTGPGFRELVVANDEAATTADSEMLSIKALLIELSKDFDGVECI